MDGCVGGRSGVGFGHAVIPGWNRSKHFQDGSVELQIPRLRSEVTFLISLVVCGWKAREDICQQASPGSFDSAP
jgi:hypothetical protein